MEKTEEPRSVEMLLGSTGESVTFNSVFLTFPNNNIMEKSLQEESEELRT